MNVICSGLLENAMNGLYYLCYLYEINIVGKTDDRNSVIKTRAIVCYQSLVEKFGRDRNKQFNR